MWIGGVPPRTSTLKSAWEHIVDNMDPKAMFGRLSTS